MQNRYCPISAGNLGDGDFVSAMLDKNDEAFDSAYRLKADGIDLDYIAKRVADLLDMAAGSVSTTGHSTQPFMFLGRSKIEYQHGLNSPALGDIDCGS